MEMGKVINNQVVTYFEVALKIQND